MAVAAAVVLTLGVGLLWRHAASAARRVPLRATVSVPAPLSSPAQLPLALTGPPLGRSAPVSSPGTSRASVNRSLANARLAEESEDFIPLPFADPEAPLGSGEVVRIRLTEADLSLLGLTVSEDASTRPLTADVVIGEDGVARAIRFVPSSPTMD